MAHALLNGGIGVRFARGGSLLALIFLLAPPPALVWGQIADNPPPPATTNVKLSHSDKSFLRNAAEGNQAAIELGRVAEQKGFSSVVKNFARKLVSERTHAQQELLAVARALNLSLPMKLSRHDRRAMQQLEDHSGQQLDRIFLTHIAAELERQYGNYEDTGMSTKNPEIKHYIGELLSEVKRQDQLARGIAPVNANSSSQQ